jgi:hypothetical protein
MGAWGHGPFENDDAGDWVWELDGDGADDLIVATLRSAATTAADAYMELPDGANGVAAAAVVASSIDGVRDELPPEAVTYLDKRAKPFDVQTARLAITALDRVAGPASEVAELWDESAGGEAWRATVEALRARLARAG